MLSVRLAALRWRSAVARSSPAQLVSGLALAASLVAAGLAVASYGYVGYFTRWWADDYCIANQVRDRGLWGAQEYWYHHWTGRFSHVFVTDALTLAGRNVVPFLAPALLCVWLVGLTLALVQLSRLLFGRTFFAGSLLLAALLLFVYLHALPQREHALYWLTGAANYTLPLAVCTFYAAFLLWAGQRERDVNRWLPIGGSFVFAFLLTGFAETYIAWQLAALSLAVAASVLLGSPAFGARVRPLLVAGLVGSAVAAVFVASAPGNDVRQRGEGPKMAIPATLVHSFDSGAGFVADSLLKPEVLLAGVATALLTFAVVSGDAGRRRLDGRRVVVHCLGALIVAYALVVTSQVPGYHFLNGTPPQRTLGTSLVSVISAVAYAGYLAGLFAAQAYRGRASRHAPRGLLAGPAAFVALLVFAAPLALPAAVHELDRGRRLSAYAAAWDERNRRMVRAVSDGRQVLKVPLLSHSSGLELREDDSAWMNRCASSYYEVLSIEAEP